MDTQLEAAFDEFGKKKKLTAQDAVAMERAVSAEVEEARCLDALARELECSALSD
ncbi:hypothetical protein H310_01441 [Aphanomyces invadans]|uniref:Uncharacterized protein n=1 Tax=Aphanomyces invadans TaxID=157072 RepID=A0A024UTL8_9STRA|nr:hypothetical protein H310_01441 [Aphanomyces invadans]ETW08963.1 hypothetical protein H310_01441 [Aphanomyces invadans]|eukprot:XP_008862768.1 hypothetical protein H310_01441 [Aphanomyces invadans]